MKSTGSSFGNAPLAVEPDCVVGGGSPAVSERETIAGAVPVEVIGVGGTGFAGEALGTATPGVRVIVRVGGKTTGSFDDCGGANAGGVDGATGAASVGVGSGVVVATGGKTGCEAAGTAAELVGGVEVGGGVSVGVGVVATGAALNDGTLARGGAAVTVGSSGGWISGSGADEAAGVEAAGVEAAGAEPAGVGGVWILSVGALSGAFDAVNAGPRAAGAAVGPVG